MPTVDLHDIQATVLRYRPEKEELAVKLTAESVVGYQRAILYQSIGDALAPADRVCGFKR